MMSFGQKGSRQFSSHSSSGMMGMKSGGYSGSSRMSMGGFGGGYGGGGYGGGGGGSFRMSSSSYSSMGGGGGGGGGWGLGSAIGAGSGSWSMALGGGGGGGGGGGAANEKQTLQGLNSRLATYLETVKKLEETNRSLELKLKQYQVGAGVSGHDFTAYFAEIGPLKEQILAAIIANARVALEVDNAGLAAADFRSKFETEFGIRQSVEMDIEGLKGLKQEYLMNCKDFENEMASINEEMIYLKKNHEEELAQLRQQVSGTISVAIDTAANVDLTKVLAEIRAQYEAVTQKNRDDVENWFKTQVEVTTVQTVQTNEAVVAANAELTEYRKQLQTLQAEFDSLMSMKLSLEAAVQETDMRYAGKLQMLAASASGLEQELIRLRADMASQAKNYQELLHVKMKLEIEINTYRQLLEGSGSVTTDANETSSSTTRTTVLTEKISTTRVI